MTTNAAMLNRAFENYVSAVRDAGITHTISLADAGPWDTRTEVTFTADDLRMQKGSPTYGHAFRLYYLSPIGGGHFEPYMEYLGWTKEEAYRSLVSATGSIRATLAARS